MVIKIKGLIGHDSVDLKIKINNKDIIDIYDAIQEHGLKKAVGAIDFLKKAEDIEI